jgi:hypothetical protein
MNFIIQNKNILCNSERSDGLMVKRTVYISGVTPRFLYPAVRGVVEGHLRLKTTVRCWFKSSLLQILFFAVLILLGSVSMDALGSNVNLIVPVFFVVVVASSNSIFVDLDGHIFGLFYSRDLTATNILQARSS